MPEPRFDVTTFGEMLLRLSVPSGERLENAGRLELYPAGAEANVTTLLSRLGRKTCWLGALPDNPLGRKACGALRLAGVDTSGIHWSSRGRMGTYYVEFGESPRGIQVIYDRSHSCTTQLQSSNVDWDLLFDSRLLHLTGITPALSASCHEIVAEAIRQAKARRVPVSFDINYRQKLWPEADAAQTLLPLLQGIELLFCSQRDALGLFNLRGRMLDVAQQLLDLSGARTVVLTFAEQGALLWNGKESKQEAARPTRIIDRLGAGDALAAGVIQGWLENDLPTGLRYGVTLAAMALSQFGDMVITNKSELLALSQQSSTLTR
jgi:2-dehydro-3-deoxygluconokinase